MCLSSIRRIILLKNYNDKINKIGQLSSQYGQDVDSVLSFLKNERVMNSEVRGNTEEILNALIQASQKIPMSDLSKDENFKNLYGKELNLKTLMNIYTVLMMKNVEHERSTGKINLEGRKELNRIWEIFAKKIREKDTVINRAFVKFPNQTQLLNFGKLMFDTSDLNKNYKFIEDVIRNLNK